jgi:hypothetical protein
MIIACCAAQSRLVLGRSLFVSLLMAMFQSMLKDLIDGPAKSVWVDRVSHQTIYRISVSLRHPIRPWTPALSSGRLPRCSHVKISPHPANDVYRSLLLVSRLWRLPTFTSSGRARKRKCMLTLGTPFLNSASLAVISLTTSNTFLFQTAKSITL